MEIVWVMLVVFGLVVLAFIAYSILSRTTQIVPDEERWVIHRLGRFHRIVGPGMVQIFPGLEYVRKRIDARNHPVEVEINGILAYGILNHLTLNLWCRIDLKEAAGNDKKKLAELALLSEVERQRQVQVKMRDILSNQIIELQKSKPLPPNASIFEKIVTLTPGTEHYKTLIERARRELEQALLSVGVILDTNQPIVLTGRNIPQTIIAAIEHEQGRQIDVQAIEKLRTQFPEIVSGKLAAQILGAREGIDVDQLDMSPEAEANTSVEHEKQRDRNTTTKITVTPPNPPPDMAEKQLKPGAPISYDLTKSDLTVLKRVPRRPQNQQMSA
jgi:hypothetical protein